MDDRVIVDSAYSLAAPSFCSLPMELIWLCSCTTTRMQKDAGGCVIRHPPSPRGSPWVLSAVAAGPQSILAISSNKIAGNKTTTMHPVSDLSSLVFSLPLDETISPELKKILSCWAFTGYYS
jgi:hypothetical protein